MSLGHNGPKRVVMWFRHGLRVHDNPTLHEAMEVGPDGRQPEIIPVFIFDGETAGTKLCGYNRFQFLLECLKDLDQKFRVGTFGRLHCFRGDPSLIFAWLKEHVGFEKLCFEQDCEPIWKTRDSKATAWCEANGVEWVEKIGHTLYDPYQIIEVNGGKPPLTFNIFNHVIDCMDPPARPKPDIDLSRVAFARLPESITSESAYFDEFPTVEDFGFSNKDGIYDKVYVGGETEALQHFQLRLEHEKDAFERGSYLPNRRDPDILCPPKSLSPDFRFGTLSVRKFYWSMLDAFENVVQMKKDMMMGMNQTPKMIVIQMLWREFFYTMSVNNDDYGRMQNNEICINVPWYESESNPKMAAFEDGMTGYPFIDAGMRQLKKEGWTHHVVRNALACFLTRGDLWISWEDGLKIFLENLLDGDWSVCAGNWMWVSSSAFDKVLNCSNCIDPGTYGRRSDPWGEYAKRYIKELENMPVEYVYEPWKAPLQVQLAAGCVIGRDYPERIVLHEEVSQKNAMKMCQLRQQLQRQMVEQKKFCGPSDEEETRQFMGFANDCSTHGELH